jgi:hypothetical protein
MTRKDILIKLKKDLNKLDFLYIVKKYNKDHSGRLPSDFVREYALEYAVDRYMEGLDLIDITFKKSGIYMLEYEEFYNILGKLLGQKNKNNDLIYDALLKYRSIKVTKISE